MAEILGHTTPALVHKTCGHVMPIDLGQAVAMMDEFFPVANGLTVVR